MPNHLKPEIIKVRAHKLQSLAKELSYNYKNKFINNEMPVLFEQLKKGYWHGHTSNYLEVKIKDNNIDLTNKVVNVKLLSFDNNIILGEEVK